MVPPERPSTRYAGPVWNPYAEDAADAIAFAFIQTQAAKAASNGASKKSKGGIMLKLVSILLEATRLVLATALLFIVLMGVTLAISIGWRLGALIIP